MNINIFNFLIQNFPNFNPENEQDIIRTEKILKAESKLNGTFTNAEIEDFLFKIKNFNTDFFEILKQTAVQKILDGEIPSKDDEITDFTSISYDNLDEFSEYCSSTILKIIKKNVQENNWEKLDFFITHYSPIISFDNYDALFEALYDKNQQLIRNISEYTDLEQFKTQFPFCADENYYQLLSNVDSFGFGNQMMTFTNSISERQNTHEKNKKILGEIVTAMSYFQSFYEEQKKLLENNRKIGEEWTKDRNSSVGEVAKSFSNFLLNEDHFGVSLLISVLMFLVSFFTIYFIYSIGIPKFITFIFILIIFMGFSFGTISQNLKLFRRDFFPYYFIKLSASIFLSLCIAIPIFILLAVVFEMTFSFQDKTNFGGALVFPIVYLLIRFFNQKK